MKTGKLYIFSVKGWNEQIYGIVENFSEEWILIRTIFSDFLLDGHTIIRRKYLKEYVENDDTIFRWKVIESKGCFNSNTTPTILINTIASPFEWLKQNNKTFILNPKDESISYVGNIEKLLKSSFYMKALNPKGIWNPRLYLYKINSIRTIDLDTDYVSSLLAYNQKHTLSGSNPIDSVNKKL